MDAHNIGRRLRGALGNALVWGVGWFAFALAGFAVLRFVGIAPAALSWLDALVLATKGGFIGSIAGGAFSGFIGLYYHGQRLSEISCVRFGIVGGVATGLFVPTFLQTMNLLSGDGLVPMELVLDDAIWTAAFGGASAGGSLKLAQHAETALRDGTQDRVGGPEGVDRLA